MSLYDMNGVEALQFLFTLLNNTKKKLEHAAATEEEWQDMQGVTAGTFIGMRVCLEAIAVMLASSGATVPGPEHPLDEPEINDSTEVPTALLEFLQRKDGGT